MPKFQPVALGLLLMTLTSSWFGSDGEGAEMENDRANQRPGQSVPAGQRVGQRRAGERRQGSSGVQDANGRVLMTIGTAGVAGANAENKLHTRPVAPDRLLPRDLFHAPSS